MNPKQQKAAKRTLVLCLDRSGSMAGTPFKALIEGAQEIGKQAFSAKNFNQISVIFYSKAAESKTFWSDEQKKFDSFLLRAKPQG